jgi:hypothetical protein
MTPGHTRAHVCLYHSPTRTLFSGDHLSSPSDVDRPGDLEVFRDFNWWVGVGVGVGVGGRRDLHL